MNEQKQKFEWRRETTASLGRIEAEIELVNGYDAQKVRNKILGEHEMRRMQVRARVDSEAFNLCINENIRQVLDLDVIQKKWVQMADGRLKEHDIVGTVEIIFKNRRVYCCSAIVLPGDVEPVLGICPLREMNVIIDQDRNELIENPDEYIARI